MYIPRLRNGLHSSLCPPKRFARASSPSSRPAPNGMRCRPWPSQCGTKLSRRCHTALPFLCCVYFSSLLWRKENWSSFTTHIWPGPNGKVLRGVLHIFTGSPPLSDMVLLVIADLIWSSMKPSISLQPYCGWRWKPIGIIGSGSRCQQTRKIWTKQV